MRFAAALLAAVLFAGAGCATTDSSCRAPVGDRSTTPAVAAADPAHVGEQVTWGGTLVEARNLEDSTELEMIGYPLDACGRPRIDAGAVGRFIIVRSGYLETAQLRVGQPMTATGAILATREGQVGDAYYRFPLLADPSPRIWPDQRVSTDAARTRPRISVGVGAGSGWSGGGVGISF